MMGFDARYVPGWDCHGLPIEHKVDAELGEKKLGMDPLYVRARCRKYAEKFIGIQRKEFRRLGVLWDWSTDKSEEKSDAPSRTAIYRTIDRTYEAEIVRQMGRFFTRGAIYHGVKPVHWCWSCKTALAEAETEYKDRVDPSIYVKLPLKGAGARVPELEGRNVSVVIWTTTPWTLPANLAVTLGPDFDYVAIEQGDELWIVAEGLLAAFAEACDLGKPTIVARFKGSALADESVAVERPYLAPEGAAAGDGRLILGDHVTLEAGTGCVHTAPGHGADDFIVGQKYGLEVFNPVDDEGRFKANRVTFDAIAGEFVHDANKTIIEDLRERGWLVQATDYEHSYPHCWRCKNALLFRSTPQWFVSMDATGLREQALKQIHATTWTPSFGEQRIAQMIETRPDWCISRQRTWGVPVPAVVCTSCSEDFDDAFVRDQALFDHVASLFAEEGSDAWYGAPKEGGGHRPYESPEERRDRLVPQEIVCPRCNKHDDLAPNDHIVDVWFESGASHGAVLGRQDGLPWPADLYLEGHDQYRGWFHSSLLVAANDKDLAPYRGVVTHGFTLDGDGFKMSKSIGNVVSPLDIASKRGAEILRLWVSMIDFLDDMRLSDETLTRNAEMYRKLRNTFRYLLGNLSGFDPQKHAVDESELAEIDRWALHSLEQLRQKLFTAYENYQYHLVYHGLHQFATVTLSSFYLDILKDRLYTSPRDSAERRSAQTAMWQIATGLCRLMAPILCFTAEEIWQELEKLSGREGWTDRSVHAETFDQPFVAQLDDALLARWERLGTIREEANKALEEARAAKTIGTSLEASITLHTGDADTRAFLESFGDDLRFLLIVSEIKFGDGGELKVDVQRADGEKCERCWHYTTDVGQSADWPGVCGRCADNIARISA